MCHLRWTLAVLLLGGASLGVRAAAPLPESLEPLWSELGDAWMKAAGRNGIPCSFEVDKTGRIAYVGWPMFLGMVLPKVLAGGASAKVVGDEMAKVDADYRTVAATFNRDPEAGLREAPGRCGRRCRRVPAGPESGWLDGDRWRRCAHAGPGPAAGRYPARVGSVNGRGAWTGGAQQAQGLQRYQGAEP